MPPGIERELHSYQITRYLCTSKLSAFNNCFLGKIIQRFCQKETITGSHILNDVKYCYCDWNLCNDSMQRCQLAVSDDEDLATPEGSGQESTTIKPEVVRTNVHTTTSAESSNIKMCNLFVICLLQYFLYYAVL